MTDVEFQTKLSLLKAMPYREDFETALCELYTRCESAHRGTVRGEVAGGALRAPKAWRHPTAYGRSDLTREQRVRQSLIGMSIHGLSDDYRNDLARLAHCYHSLPLLNMNPDLYFEEIASLSAPETAHFIRAFANRRPEDKSLNAFGLHIVEMPDGPAVEPRG